ncbi:uncharacterized protein SCDLUD_005308 [Saccharomycodes ludwigii]|uniref:uncharacterized protein n=1 Tax=Saccharomycodes ludwigii TaxID=36035 RepID=UPI001E851C9D|nr:hypothetical protein SCDLUD_005308 [Saccharomycodes ludwigii]KAH3898961.1 hypothetical protein SCDLUD_005308 [Saccharomycodes ludwigii]
MSNNNNNYPRRSHREPLTILDFNLPSSRNKPTINNKDPLSTNLSLFDYYDFGKLKRRKEKRDRRYDTYKIDHLTTRVTATSTNNYLFDLHSIHNKINKKKKNERRKQLVAKFNEPNVIYTNALKFFQNSALTSSENTTSSGNMQKYLKNIEIQSKLEKNLEYDIDLEIIEICNTSPFQKGYSLCPTQVKENKTIIIKGALIENNKSLSNNNTYILQSPLASEVLLKENKNIQISSKYSIEIYKGLIWCLKWRLVSLT